MRGNEAINELSLWLQRGSLNSGEIVFRSNGTRDTLRWGIAIRSETSNLDDAFRKCVYWQPLAGQVQFWQDSHCQRTPDNKWESLIVVPQPGFRIAHHLSYSKNRRIGTCFPHGYLHDPLADKFRLGIPRERGLFEVLDRRFGNTGGRRVS